MIEEVGYVTKTQTDLNPWEEKRQTSEPNQATNGQAGNLLFKKGRYSEYARNQ